MSDVIEDPPLLPNTLFDIAGGKRGIEVVVEDCSLPTEVGFGLLILYFLSVISSTVRASLLLIFLRCWDLNEIWSMLYHSV